MNIRRWPSLLSALIVAGFWIGGSPESYASRTNKILVYPTGNETVQDLRAQGITQVRDYGSYWVVTGSDDVFARLKGRFGDRAVKANYLNVLELEAAPIDTGAQAAGLPAFPTQGSGLYLVQYVGPILPQWVENLKKAGAQVLRYVPNNGYLVRMTGAVGERLRSQLAPTGPIQWVGEYRPGYKIQPSLRNSAGLEKVRVIVAPEGNPTAALNAVRSLATRQIKSPRQLNQEWILELEVPAANLASLAANPQVLRIERVPQYQRRDEKAALITATFTNRLPGRVPPLGSDYIEWLEGLGFTNDPSQYPVLDVADSGLDLGLNPDVNTLAVLHPDFYEYPAPPIELLITATVDDQIARVVGSLSRVAYRWADDTDGHGTLVASIAVGSGSREDETINRITKETREQCATNFQFIAQCLTNQVITITNGIVVTNIVIESCTRTNIACTNICVVVTNEPALQWPATVEKTDVLGFRFGTGVNPFGRVGASPGGAEGSAFPGPETAILRAYLSRARISNNSWGQILVVNGNDGVYDSDSLAYDLLTRDAILNQGGNPIPGPSPVNQEMVIVFAGGNSNGLDPVGGFGDVLVTPPATAKNVITVGASENVPSQEFCLPFISDNDNSTDISYFNSFGPTRDGRFKPDLVAPGASVFGAKSQASYTPARGFGPNPNNPRDPCGPDAEEVNLYVELYRCDSGTSFAAPAVSGGAQLLWWWLRNVYRMLPPSPAMIKAYMLNAARYLETENPLYPGALDTLPSIAQGMGIMDLERMFDDVPRVLRDQTTPRALDTGLITTNPVHQQTYFSRSGQSYELQGLVARSDEPFRVTLAWTDAPGDPNSFVQLVNNLELEVSIGGKLYKGNVFSGPHSVGNAGQFDDVNNVESVFLPPGGPVTAGAPYRVVVRAFNIAGDGVPNVGSDLDQDFALVVYNSVTNDPPSDVPNLATNDACQTATTLTSFPVSITNNINKATYRNVHISPSAARGGVEAFYRIPTPTPGTTFTITTAGSGFAPVLSVWRVRTVPQTILISGECGALVEHVSVFNPVAGQSALSFVADGSNTYFIVAEPFNNGNGGNLVLNVSASAPAIAASPATIDFGSVIVGLTSTVQTVTFANNSTVPVFLSEVQVTGDFFIEADACSGQAILPGGSCAVRVAFAPSTTGLRTGELRFFDDATGSPRLVALSGTGVPPAPLVCLSTSAALVFTNTAVGELSTDSPRALVLTNCGTANLTVTNVVLVGQGSNDFSVVENCISGSPIPPGGTCSLNVSFTPVTNGLRSGTLRILASELTAPVTVALQGNGFIRTPEVCLSRTSLLFSNTVVGEVSGPLSVTITNCGTTNLVISGVSIVGANPADFSITGNTCGTLTVGQTCRLDLTFNPTDGGSRVAVLTITNNAAGSPHSVTLSGNGLSSQPDALIGRVPRLRFDRLGRAIGFVGQNITNSTGLGQSVTNRVTRGRNGVRNFIAIRNIGSTPDEFIVQGPAEDSGFQIRYYLGTTTDIEITDEVSAGGFEIGRLAPASVTGDATMLRIDLAASTNVVRGTTNSFLITVTSSRDPTKRDAVRTVIIAR
ncbi:MAG: choice-of-anchor D domain-containing protein [Verrucomicrobiae bacterium]|nr:choice-of-anchor D domain-containing protein [Verrucomicrobiae bacterium]